MDFRVLVSWNEIIVRMQKLFQTTSNFNEIKDLDLNPCHDTYTYTEAKLYKCTILMNHERMNIVFGIVFIIISQVYRMRI